MGRKKSYRREDLVAEALGVFWEKGYENTSLADLQHRTGVNKFGIYSEFGSKRGLFLVCADYYVAHYLAPAFDAFVPSLTSLEAFLLGLVGYLENTGYQGCLLINAAAEQSGRDAEVNRRLEATYGRLTKKLEQYWGDERAQTYSVFVRGLMTSARMGVDGNALRQAVAASLPLWR